MDKINKMFCPKCGLELNDKLYFIHYDEKNGEELYLMMSTCPNKKWYNFGHTSKFLRTKDILTLSGDFIRREAFFFNKEGKCLNPIW